MLEDVFSNHGLTLRVYTKRITPLSLFEIIINQLTPDHNFVVMEYSMYFRHHVRVLTELLPPTVGILLNIDKAHIGVDGIKTPDDIWNAKSPLLLAAEFGFAESGCWTQLSSKTVLPPGIQIFDWKDDVKDNNDRMPFIQSRLTYLQIKATLVAVKSVFGSVEERDFEAVYSSKPRENRLSKIPLSSGSLAYFDGEVTTSFRLFAFGDTLYPKKILVIRDVEFYDQDLESQSEQFREAMLLFGLVYVHVDLQKKFSNFITQNCPQAIMFSDFGEIVCEGEIFIHWGAYWRSNTNPPVF